jgi:hypothetical protein
MSSEKDETSLADDLLHGYEAIGAFIGKSPRATEHQFKQGNLPLRRMGRLIVGSKSVLRKYFTGEAA